MASVSATTDTLSAPSSNSLVLPPTNTTQFALGQPAIDAAQDTLSTTGLPTSSSASYPTATGTATTGVVTTDAPIGATAETTTSTAPLGNVSSQPLAVVLDALASAGVDNAINDALLAPSVGVVGESAGTFSNFMEELFTTLAAQAAAPTTSAQQNAAAAVQTTSTAQQATAAAQTTAAQTGAVRTGVVQTVTAPTAAAQSTAAAQAAANSAIGAFAVNAPATAANSAFESDLQTLAQTVTAGTTDGAATSVAPLQQSFAQFVAGVGGTASSASLGGFLQALASNLHTAQSPRGNLVNLQA